MRRWPQAFVKRLVFRAPRKFYIISVGFAKSNPPAGWDFIGAGAPVPPLFLFF